MCGGTTDITARLACRELAVQLDQQVEALGRSCNVRHLLVVGGLDQFAQATELRKRPHVVVATPGRLADMMNTAAELQQAFRRTAVLVLDEADRVLEHCFEQPLRDIMQVTPSHCHLLLLCSANGSAVGPCMHVTIHQRTLRWRERSWPQNVAEAAVVSSHAVVQRERGRPGRWGCRNSVSSLLAPSYWMRAALRGAWQDVLHICYSSRGKQ